MQSLTELNAKWQPVLEHEDISPIGDYYRRNSTAVILQNTENEITSGKAYNGTTLLGEAAPTNHTGSEIDNFDPVLISLVRRAMPNLIAYDICGVQPMNGPTGLIFAMRSRYANQTGGETFYNEVN